jgi:hypothetical protein
MGNSLMPVTVLIPGVPTIVPEAGVAGDIVVTGLSNGKGSCVTYTPVPGGPTQTAQTGGQSATMWSLFAACAAVDPSLMAGLQAIAAAAI